MVVHLYYPTLNTELNKNTLEYSSWHQQLSSQIIRCCHQPLEECQEVPEGHSHFSASILIGESW